MKTIKSFRGGFFVVFAFIAGAIIWVAGVFRESICNIGFGLGLMIICVMVVVVQGFYFYNIRIVRLVKKYQEKKRTKRKSRSQNRRQAS